MYAEGLYYLLETNKKKCISYSKHLIQKLDCIDKKVKNIINSLCKQGYFLEYCRISQKYFIKKVRKILYRDLN
ncbi:MAG: hypothetical protein CVU00_11730 [Bacteroidetes bacterium HGW-Bacteroidetes-17]|jgi:hypothetical protein|nr:MAG: hypothetical protein CVU00_11730 [Bacteroidetes bacterium HGW-Bacteroidetes-17]